MITRRVYGLPRWLAACTLDRQVRYMVIETFRHGPGPVYERAAERGRMLPTGLAYLDSWVDADRLDRCFQLMETDDRALLEEWTARWDDLAEFEIVPVVDSAEAARRTGSGRPSA